MKVVQSVVTGLLTLAATSAALAGGFPGFGPSPFPGHGAPGFGSPGYGAPGYGYGSGPHAGYGSVPHLDHVFLIVEENHSFGQIVGNPAMPFINKQISDGKVNLATNYFAVGHPSFTNYLELVGASNFGIRGDNPPDWHNHNCKPDIVGRTLNADTKAPAGALPAGVTQDLANGSAAAPVCPIAGTGFDAATPVIDTWNEVDGPYLALASLDGKLGVPAAPTVGETIADQLAQRGLSWKSYQESLPGTGADGVNNANGTTYDTAKFLTTIQTQGNSNGSASANPVENGIVNDYAVKHNPFAYFRSVQEGTFPGSSLKNTVPFDGANGLYADLATGDLPTFALIAPNQCNDQHGRDNGDAFCQDDPGEVAFTNANPDNTELTNGDLGGLNPGLAANADASLNRIVTAITSSPAWNRGNNVIIVVWDENDYSGATASQIPGATTGLVTAYDSKGVPTAATFTRGELNNVVLTVQTSWHGGGKVSNNFYNSYSVLKSIETGLGLPYLNHAADSNVAVFSDLF